MCPIVQRLIMKCVTYETTHLTILTELKNGHAVRKRFSAHFAFIIKNSFHEIEITKLSDLQQHLQHRGPHGYLVLVKKKINLINLHELYSKHIISQEIKKSPGAPRDCFPPG